MGSIDMVTSNIGGAPIETTHAVKEDGSRYRELVEQASDGILLVDKDGKILLANTEICRMLGYPRDELLSLNIRDTYPLDEARLADERRLDVYSGKALRFERMMRRKDGAIFPVEVSIRKLSDGTMQGIVHDVTERKQTQDALHEAHGRLRRLVDSNIVGILIADSAGHVLEANDYYLRLIGFTREELVQGKVDWRAITPPEWLPADERAIRELREQGTCTPYEKEYVRRGGTRVQVFLADAMLPGPGEQIAAFALDLTEKKRTEQALRQAQDVLRIRNEIAEVFLTAPNEDMYARVLAIILEALQSKFGVFGYIDEDGNLVTPTLTQVRDQCRIPDKSIVLRRETWHGSWPRAIREKRMMYSNEPSTATPEGHVPINRYISLPLIHQNEVVGLIQVANKDKDYTAGDIALLETIAGAIAPVLDARLKNERKEQQLKESEATIRAVFDSAIDGILVPDAETHRLLLANRAICDMLGYSPEEITGLSIEDIHPTESLPHVLTQFERQLKGEIKVAIGIPVKRKDGSLFLADISTSPARLGERPVMVGVFHDMTERMFIEESLRSSEQQYRDLFDNASDAIIIFTPENEIILEANDHACRMYGFLKQEFVGMSLRSLTKNVSQGQKQIAELLESGRSWNFETVHRNRSGEELNVLVNSSVIQYRGQRAVLSMNRDITEIRRAETKRLELEQQVIQFQKMEAIGQLAGGVAHDFNNVLMAIMSYSELLLLKLKDDSRHDVEQILKAAEKASTLTRQLLTFSRKQILQPKILDMNGIIQDIQDMLHRLLGEDIELTTELESRLGRVQADPGQMQQVMLNLAANARDAMPRGGRLTIHTANVSLTEKDLPLGLNAGPYVRIQCSDTGTGMNEEVRSHLFEPFFTTKEVGKGTGLGLATVYGIIKQSGGHITVESAPGEGATFVVYLATVDQPSAELTHVKREPPPVGTETLLLVDDNDTIRSAVGEILRMSGYTVFQAPDGEAALDLATKAEKPIDLLLTDVVMPKMDGIMLEEKIRQNYPGTRTLFMSGYSKSGVERYGLADSSRAFLQKPVPMDTLLRAIRTLLDEKEPTGKSEAMKMTPLCEPEKV